MIKWLFRVPGSNCSIVFFYTRNTADSKRLCFVNISMTGREKAKLQLPPAAICDKKLSVIAKKKAAIARASPNIGQGLVVSVSVAKCIHIHSGWSMHCIPYHPCMEYLPRFTISLSHPCRYSYTRHGCFLLVYFFTWNLWVCRSSILGFFNFHASKEEWPFSPFKTAGSSKRSRYLYLHFPIKPQRKVGEKLPPRSTGLSGIQS